MVVAAGAVDLRRAGVSVVSGPVGARPWTSGGKASHLSRPLLFVSEVEMGPLLDSEVWGGEEWGSWDPWREPPI